MWSAYDTEFETPELDQLLLLNGGLKVTLNKHELLVGIKNVHIKIDGP